MSKRKKRHGPKSSTRSLQPLQGQSEHIPADDRYVLKEDPGLPLERGGIYSEMGADMTYEELRSFPTTGNEFTHYEQHQEVYKSKSIEVLGIILVLLGLIIVIFSPFWFSTITLGITLIAHRYSLNMTRYTALAFTIIGVVLAIYSTL